MTHPLVPIRRLFRVINGGTPTPDPVNWDGDVPWATPVDLSAAGQTIASTERRLTTEGLATGSRLAPAGSILVSTRAPIGYLSICSVPMAFNQGCRALAPHPGVDPRFFAYQLMAQRDELRGAGQGSTFLELSSESLGAFPVAMAPNKEQRRIAGFLDDQVARLDTALGAQARQKQLVLERFRSELAVRTLLNADSPGVTPTRVKYLFEYERNGIWGADPDGGPDDVACVRVADFDRERFTATPAPTIRSVPRAQRFPRLLRRGDVLLEKSGGTNDKPVGCAVTYLSDEPSVCSNFVAVLRPTSSVVPRFAGLLLAAMYQTRRNGPFVNQTTGIQNLDSGTYLSQEIWVPGHAAQEAIVKRVEDAGERAEQLMSLADSRIRLLEERKQTLITAAVTGEFDVTTARAVA